ncbi:hypothetical protein [Gordonia rubripertincta]|uniref:hypothetical protein n=1 Tax=Gordonia rubripertincta TaxID=36822 RepID=UPI000B8D9BE7|nr:hypothetical protein [Gordonia rubripertincta]ASR05601.1 hypothetical protein GCWB2_24150 [Gordonia rubripertincta]
MNTPPLHERLNRLVSFAHPRNQPSLTNREIADKASTILEAPVDEALIAALRNGSVTVLTDDLRQALGQVFGLQDLRYLAAPRSVAENNQILLMHDRLALIAEARDLGVQHIATRDVDQDPNLVRKLRAALGAMIKAPSQTQ